MRRATCLILAGGDGRRMGRDKATLEIAGRSSLEHIVAALPRSIRVVCVTGKHSETVQRHISERPRLRTRVELAVNPAPERGRTSSIQAGAARIDRGFVLVWPVDIPIVERSTVQRLLSRARHPCHWIQPVAERRGGHPIVMGHELVRLVTRLAPDRSLRSLRDHPWTERVLVDVGDPGIHLDLNTEQDVESARQRLRRQRR